LPWRRSPHRHHQRPEHAPSRPRTTPTAAPASCNEPQHPPAEFRGSPLGRRARTRSPAHLHRQSQPRRRSQKVGSASRKRTSEDHSALPATDWLINPHRPNQGRRLPDQPSKISHPKISQPQNKNAQKSRHPPRERPPPRQPRPRPAPGDLGSASA